MPPQCFSCVFQVWEMQRYSFNYTAMFELKWYLFNQNVYCGLLARSFLHDIEKGNISTWIYFFLFLSFFFFLCWNDRQHPLGGITPSLRFQVACIRGCHQSLGSQSGEWPMVSYKFDQFWTSSTFKLGGVKCTESLVSCVGEMDEAFGIFQDQIFSAMTEATESLRVLNWTAALSQTHLAFQLRICTPITSSY